VPGIQVVERDGGDGGQLWLMRVRRVGAVDELGGFTAGDLVLFVVAADDAGGDLLLRELELFRREVRVQKQIEGKRKDPIGVGFERVPGERGGIDVAAGLDVGGLGLEEIVEGVAADFGGARGAPALAVKRDEAGLGGVNIALTAGDRDRSRDEGQLVILLEEEDDAVGKFDALGLMGLEVVQLGDGDLLPGLGGHLRWGRRCLCNGWRRSGRRESLLHIRMATGEDNCRKCQSKQ